MQQLPAAFKNSSMWELDEQIHINQLRMLKELNPNNQVSPPDKYEPVARRAVVRHFLD